MDYQKLDGFLQAAIEDTQDQPLTVFIRTEAPVGAKEAEYLRGLGVHDAHPSQKIYTATLAPTAVDELSEQPWVESMALSQQLQPK